MHYLVINDKNNVTQIFPTEAEADFYANSFSQLAPSARVVEADNPIPLGSTVGADNRVTPPVLNYDSDLIVKRDYDQIWIPQKGRWAIGLQKYEGSIPTLGIAYLNAGDQGLLVIINDSAIPLELKRKIIRNMSLGALDINSEDKFAEAIDLFGAAPAMKIIWVNKDTGERVPLAQATMLGELDTTYRSYQRS